MTFVWWGLGGLAMVGVVFLAGMRGKWGFVTSTVRRMNKRFMNPMQMKSAGQPGAYAGIIRHVGRTSGIAYETPVGIEATPDGFVIALVYGPGVDWLKNVLAAGEAELVWEGATHRAIEPRVVGFGEVGEYFDDGDTRTFRTMNIEDFLLLDRG